MVEIGGRESELRFPRVARRPMVANGSLELVPIEYGGVRSG